MKAPKGSAHGEANGSNDGAFETDFTAYERDLARGLAVSGEGRSYFARGRLQVLRARLHALGLATPTLLDFGCGDGSSTALYHELLEVQSVTGVDRSRELLGAARAHHAGEHDEFREDHELPPTPAFDGAFSNGVFHHLALEDREPAARYVFERLRPGAWFALCENNPWNPGTRWVMSRIEFDKDAILLSANRARSILMAAGFQIASTDSLFFFPHSLRWLRGLEPRLRSVPFGAQYMVLARK